LLCIANVKKYALENSLGLFRTKVYVAVLLKTLDLSLGLTDYLPCTGALALKKMVD
jgi:hypothetical protein